MCLPYLPPLHHILPHIDSIVHIGHPPQDAFLERIQKIDIPSYTIPNTNYHTQDPFFLKHSLNTLQQFTKKWENHCRKLHTWIKTKHRTHNKWINNHPNGIQNFIKKFTHELPQRSHIFLGDYTLIQHWDRYCEQNNQPFFIGGQTRKKTHMAHALGWFQGCPKQMPWVLISRTQSIFKNAHFMSFFNKKTHNGSLIILFTRKTKHVDTYVQTICRNKNIPYNKIEKSQHIKSLLNTFQFGVLECMIIS